MICLRSIILLFEGMYFMFVGSYANCIEFIAEKRQREGIMAKFTPITAEGCVETCEHLNTCFAVNYFRLNVTCQLLNRTMPESKLIKTTKCFYKAVRSPSKEMIDNDPCFKLTCPWDEICMHNITSNLAECYPFCKNPPTIPGTPEETVDLEVGQNYTYRCRDGLFGKRDQISTVTCLRDGHWTGTNFTCVCNTPPTKYGAINEIAELEVGQNYTYKCQNGLIEKGDLNPTITCLENGSWTSTNLQCVKLNWTQDTIYYNNTHESGLISNVTEIDLLECMRHCDDMPNKCLSFFYDNHTRLCFLSSSFRRGLPQYLQSSEGLVYYTAPSISCDMGYRNVSLEGSYFCIKAYTNKTTFNDAMRLCELDMAELLVITTEDQIEDLKPHVPDGWTYIGISDETKEGTWISWDGKAVTGNLFWNPGEPNGRTSENCGSISSYYMGLFDTPCLWNLNFVCSKT
ncbi:hypothetical protein ACJMK2_001690 [Sinanodonta woodiana]|uniref:Uncharacterized protein n=1 Tax=Sinanodonta woodiana TaxID=1069815 RepID=A0ABD3XUM1_SINWO